MQEDYNLHGPEFFRYGLIDSWEYIGDEMAEIWRNVEGAWAAAMSSQRPAYNQQSVRDQRYLPCKDIAQIGQRHERRPQQTKSMRGLHMCGIFVLTCRKNKKQYVGMTTDCKWTIKEMMQNLRRGGRDNAFLQGDFDLHGEAQFFLEFCEMPEATKEDLRAIRREVIQRLGAYYNEAAERERCKNFFANFKGAVGGRPAPKERSA